jgi:hypothetical protein
VKVEDTNALRYILQDELYLLDEDKNRHAAIDISAPATQTPAPAFNYLGSNKKNFLILVAYNDHEFMQDDHLAALESVMGRKGHTRDDAAILNLAKNEGSFNDITTFFSPQMLLILGASAHPAGLGELKFNAIKTINSIKALATFSFGEMMDNVDNKKAFWEQIKNF